MDNLIKNINPDYETAVRIYNFEIRDDATVITQIYDSILEAE